MDFLRRFWEDQHPLVRMNISIGGGFLLLWLGLHAIIRVGMQASEPATLFRLHIFMQMFSTLALLMGVLALYNVLRLLWLVINRHSSPQAVALAALCVLVLVIPVLYPPDLVKAAIARSSGASFSQLYEEVLALCDSWQTIEDVASIELATLETAPQIFRVQETIVFNYAVEQPDYGLACALQDHRPATVGLAANYEYDPVGGAVYTFLEETQR